MAGTTVPLTLGRPRDGRWYRGAQWARRLAWVSVATMLTEDVLGLWQGLAAGSIALTAWWCVLYGASQTVGE